MGDVERASRDPRWGWGPGRLAVVLLLLRGVRAAPTPLPSTSHSVVQPSALQEQEINLKLRILVPRDNRHLHLPLSQYISPGVSGKPLPLIPDAALGLASIPMRPPAAPQPISVVSSLSSVAPLSTPLMALIRPPTSGTHTLTQTPVMGSYVIARPVSYRKVPVRALHPAYAPQLPYSHQYAAVPGVPRVPASFHSWPATHTGIQYNFVGHLPPKNINITMEQRKPELPDKACNCTAEGAASPDEEQEDPAPVLEDAEEVPTTPKPIGDAWLGYIPPDLLDHAKNVLLKGKVNVEKDQVHFRQKWKHSNYPQHHQQQKIPGVGEDLWKALKEDLKDLTKDDGSEDFHDHDAEFDDSASDGFDDGHDYETIQTEENDGTPYFVDFWGNRVPQYGNRFKNSQETEEDAEQDYNSDPNGWNPQYTKGMWADNDQHLQVFSGYQNNDPNAPKPVYENGMGENYHENYNKYVADNGTWLGRPAPPPPENLRDILKDSVSYEEGLENPSDHHATYADVIRYLNSKRLPVRVRRRKRPRPRPRPRLMPRPMPRPMLRPRVPLAPHPQAQPSRYNPNLVDVNQLVEALILHKERERERRLAEQQHSRNSVEDDTEDEYDEEGEDDEEDAEAPARITSNAHGSPPTSVCKGIRDVGVTQDGHEMAHVQGVVCSNSYDFSAGEGAEESTASASAPATVLASAPTEDGKSNAADE